MSGRVEVFLLQLSVVGCDLGVRGPHPPDLSERIFPILTFYLQGKISRIALYNVGEAFQVLEPGFFPPGEPFIVSCVALPFGVVLPPYVGAKPLVFDTDAGVASTVPGLRPPATVPQRPLQPSPALS